ncbi:MAG: hypothetical protein JOY87_12780 [Candidatus Eremiobacteraeota bacterium]|nr:hypothetical protein [Candidatus Eremiobacteraeota bacterium]MBV8339791.1 hypothetical protein [Candidatus Eremiobacteraeota bacterium]MBV8667905.1 hypothetical protein [Candidatus Eremiobacteraeota bacterium]
MKLKLVAVALALGAALTAGSVAFADDSMSSSSMAMQGRFGGPVYNGPPALAVTASLVAAGGGADKYSTATALTSMLGQDTVNAEVAKLTKQYGADAVKMWLKTFDFAVDDALKIATAAGVKLPSPTLSGKELATTLVKAGTAADGTFQIEYLLDKAVTHKIHVQVMDDIDNDPSLGKKADYDYHRISNQAFYDVAQALGMTSVKLAAVH